MREYFTAATEAEAAEVDEGSEISVDGKVLRYYKPTSGQYAIYMAESASRFTGNSEKTAATINFFMDLWDEDSRKVLAGWLLDRDSGFGVDQVMEIMNEMMEEWAGRPTKPSTGSTQSRTSGGRKSTRTTPALTSSAKSRAAS